MSDRLKALGYFIALFVVFLALHLYVLTLIPENNLWFAVFVAGALPSFLVMPFIPKPEIGSLLEAQNIFTASMAALTWTFIIFELTHLIRRRRRTGMSILGDSFKLRREI